MDQGKLGFLGPGFKNLRSRLLFVFVGLLIFRIGSHIPVPGVDLARLADVFNQHGSGLLGLFNVFSGGALSRLSLFALGIMPYISASIIMQLMGMVVPFLMQLRKEGERGRQKISYYTRFLTLLISLFQAYGITKWLAGQGVVLEPNGLFYITAVLTLSTGTLFLMWLGEQITERGIGNGISLIIFAGIVSRFPSALGEVFGQVRQGQMHGLTLIVLLLLVVAITAFVVYVERAQRRLPVQYARQSRGPGSSQTNHLPLKINMAGVIPPIFASSLILLPASLAAFFGQSYHIAWLLDLNLLLQPGELLYMLFYIAGIVFFCFLYTSMIFNPKETADNLKKSGALIPGIRPGKATADHINQVMERLTLVGAMYLSLVAILPQFLIRTWHIPFYFGGTSLLIVVVVVMDFVAQIQSHIMSQKYDSLLGKQGKRSAKKGGSSNLSLLS